MNGKTTDKEPPAPPGQPPSWQPWQPEGADSEEEEEEKLDEKLDAKPVEWRTLRSPYSKNAQGRLKLFCDIVQHERAKDHPTWDVALPPPSSWELRVVVWRTAEVKGACSRSR